MLSTLLAYTRLIAQHRLGFNAQGASKQMVRTDTDGIPVRNYRRINKIVQSANAIWSDLDITVLELV